MAKHTKSGKLLQHRKAIREPDNPRQSMEPTDMEPDDARQFIKDLESALISRVRAMPDDEFEKPPQKTYAGDTSRAKQYFGNDTYQLISGIVAALRNWDESGEETQELKEEYGGRFVDGVEIGERLAVHQGSDFTFVGGEDDESQEKESKFTFTQ